MRSKLCMVLLCGMLGCGVLSCQTPAPTKSPEPAKTSAPTNSPEETAVAFYKWYVHEIDQGHIPMSRSREQLDEYLSSSLIKRLQLRKGAEGLDADYFLKAQDTLEDWAANVTASPVKSTGNAAQILVTLGASQETRHRLSVALVQEDGKWKIASVIGAHKTE